MRAFAKRYAQSQEQPPSVLSRADLAARGRVNGHNLDHVVCQPLKGSFRFDFGRIAVHGTAAIDARQALGASRFTENSAGSKALPATVRARMEQAFGFDLGGVRVHDDGAARTRADALDAQAFVEAGEIHWSDNAPPLESPAAAPLLAHEVSHVVQQRQASSIEDRISSPGEPSEVAAQAMARQAFGGRVASAGRGSAVAAILRQSKGDMSAAPADKEIEIEMITAFLQKVVSTAPPQDLKKAKVVRNALKMLAGQNFIDIDKFVEASGTPSDPSGMAQAFAEKLPPFRKADLDKLANLPFIDPTTLTDRLGDLAKKYPAGKGETNPVPGDVGPEQKSDDIAKRMKVPSPHSGQVDLFGLWRVLRGAKDALNPKSTTAKQPQGDLSSAMATAIGAIDKGALLPPEAKGQGQDADNWIADAQAFAVALATGIDVAQSSKDKHEFSIALPPAYEGVKDKAAIITAIGAIITMIRDLRPDHASNVKVIVTVAVGRTHRIFMTYNP